VSWSLKGSNLNIKEPKSENDWNKSKASAISLIPPFSKRQIEIDADRALFKDGNISSATVRFVVLLAGKPQNQKNVILRGNDAQSTQKITLYHDPNQTVGYQITWYDKKGKELRGDVHELTDNYLLLVPPAQ
jgi:hypothetical protein